MRLPLVDVRFYPILLWSCIWLLLSGARSPLRLLFPLGLKKKENGIEKVH